MTNDSTSEKFPSVVSSAATATPDSGRMEVVVLERGGGVGWRSAPSSLSTTKDVEILSSRAGSP